MEEGHSLEQAVDHVSELHFAEYVKDHEEASGFLDAIDQMMDDDGESLWPGLDEAANHFDNTLKALAALGDFGWKLTKDTATNTWKITEPIVKPAAKDIAKKLKAQGLKGW